MDRKFITPQQIVELQEMAARLQQGSKARTRLHEAADLRRLLESLEKQEMKWTAL